VIFILFIKVSVPET